MATVASACREQASHHLFEGIVVHAVDMFTGQGDHPRFDGFNAPPCLLRAALGREPQVYPGLLGQGGDLDVLRRFDDIAMIWERFDSPMPVVRIHRCRMTLPAL